jgi:hypothetical protein
VNGHCRATFLEWGRRSIAIFRHKGIVQS